MLNALEPFRGKEFTVMFPSTKTLLPMLATAALLTAGCIPEEDSVDESEVLSTAQGVALQLESIEGVLLTSFEVSDALMREEDGDRMKVERSGESERPDNGRPYEVERIDYYVITDLNGADPACVTVEISMYLNKPGSDDTIEAQAVPGPC